MKNKENSGYQKPKISKNFRYQETQYFLFKKYKKRNISAKKTRCQKQDINKIKIPKSTSIQKQTRHQQPKTQKNPRYQENKDIKNIKITKNSRKQNN